MSDEAGPAEWELLDRTRARLVALDAERFRLLEDIAELERRDVASSTGDRTARLLEEIGRLARGEAQRLVAEARDLVPGRSLQGEPLPPRRPCTARVHASGEIGAAHVAIIRRTMDRVDRVVTVRPETAAWAEAFLAEQATLLGPRGLERVARQLLEAVDPDGTAPDEGEDGFDELRLHQRPDGSLVLRGAIHDAADVALVRAGFDAASAPAGPDDERSLERRRAAALTELVAGAVAPGGLLADDEGRASEPGSEPEPALLAEPRRAESSPRARGAAGAGRALLTITMDHRWLCEAVQHGTLDGGSLVGAATVRRWACDAEVVPMVLGSRSEPLDVGRLSRTIPDAIRRALNLRDGGCAFPACDRQPRRCHAHHIHHWADGGPTCLDNLVLLCPHHHQVLHRGHWVVEMIDGRPWFVPPERVDPERRPRPGGRHPVTAP